MQRYEMGIEDAILFLSRTFCSKLERAVLILLVSILKAILHQRGGGYISYALVDDDQGLRPESVFHTV